MAEHLIGSRVGHIRITDALGEGGMGAVYVGYDEKLQRRIALKAVRGGNRGPEYRSRFLREARALSLLNHPYICQIYDFIEAEGQDFLALELIEGKSLARVIAEGPDFSAKMRIACQLVDVLVATHAKSVIHRDLKPTNVMVTHGGDVKVLDFGLAFAAADDAQTQTSLVSESDALAGLTQAGTPIGTVRYMSPEQARGERVTTATDMFAYGLILQELFTESPAYEKGLSPAAQVERAKSGQSRAVSGLDSDLTALINRLKDPAPAVRPSAIDAKDRLIWIADRPRRRIKRLATGAAIIVSVAVAVALTYQAYRVRVEALRANREAIAAQQITDFLIRLFAVSDPSEARGNSVTAREILDAGVVRIEKELAAQPETQARLLATMGDVYRSLGLFVEAHRMQELALKQRLSVLGAGHADTLASMHKLGAVLTDLGRHGEAERYFRDALEGRRRIVGSDDDATLTSMTALGAVLVRQGKRAEAEPYLREVYVSRRRLKGASDVATLTSLINLGAILRLEGKFTDAQGAYQEVLDAYQQQSDLDNPRALTALYNLGDLRLAIDDAVGAERLFRDVLDRQQRVLGAEHPTTLRTTSTVAETMLAQERFAEAAEQFRVNLAVQQRILPANHPDIGATRKGLAEALIGLSKPGEAEAHLRDLLGSRWNDPWYAAEVRNLLGHTLAKQGKFQEAERLLTESYEEMAANPNPSRRLGQRAALQRVVELYEAWQKHDLVQRWRNRMTP